MGQRGHLQPSLPDPEPILLSATAGRISAQINILANEPHTSNGQRRRAKLRDRAVQIGWHHRAPSAPVHSAYDQGTARMAKRHTTSPGGNRVATYAHASSETH